MDGTTLLSGGCGAVPKVKNPICLAYDIYQKQLTELPLGLVPPSLLVGRGALHHAKNSGLQIVNSNHFMTQKTVTQYKKYSRMIEARKKLNNDNGPVSMDTVGAACVDKFGNVASGCSSGGLILKQPGRVGQAALYACGVYADSFHKEKEHSVAVSTSGCGEHLVLTQLAKEIANDLKKSDNLPTISLSNIMKTKFLGMYRVHYEKYHYKSMFVLCRICFFLESDHLHNIDRKMGGALVIFNGANGLSEVLWAHSTSTMSIGYMKTTDKKPSVSIIILLFYTTNVYTVAI